jgi:hypothetical protein
MTTDEPRRSVGARARILNGRLPFVNNAKSKSQSERPEKRFRALSIIINDDYRRCINGLTIERIATGR